MKFLFNLSIVTDSFLASQDQVKVYVYLTFNFINYYCSLLLLYCQDYLIEVIGTEPSNFKVSSDTVNKSIFLHVISFLSLSITFKSQY